MPSITIKNVPEPLHDALRQQAARHGRSTEAEICHILLTALQPTPKTAMQNDLVTLLGNIGRDCGITDADVDVLNNVRDKMPAKPLDLS